MINLPQRRNPRESAESACRLKAGAQWLATRTDRKINTIMYHSAIQNENFHIFVCCIANQDRVIIFLPKIITKQYKMTLQELNYTFFKAHILMGAGYVLGEIVANGRGMSCTWVFGILMGLLFSLRLYYKCITALLIEYKRLKTKNRNENFS